ncbi:MAG: glycosyltransferase family 4 protein [Ignavibacteria bacterium]|nr:glycosyltransferase family 4 protein [Ignavibacteria bacterium]
MNILVLYQSPWWNAAAYYTYYLVRVLTDNNHKVIFVGSKDSPAAKKINELEVQISDLDLLVASPFKFISNIRKTKKLVDDERIDLIIPISAPGHIISGILKKIYGKKTPLVKVCLDNLPPTNNVFNRYLHNKLTEYFIFPGMATKARYDKFFNIVNFKVQHAPLELEKFIDYEEKENLREVLGVPSNKIIVSFIGRFSPEKGIFFLLEIISKVLKVSENIFFILSGSEEQIKYEEVNIFLNKKNIQNDVKVLPLLNDVRNLISITDIGILSSRYSEYICRIALEFMAFRKSLVAPELNVIPEVVMNEESGYLYKLEDSSMAADLILKLTDNSFLRENMGVNGFKRLQDNYSLKIFAGEIEKIIKKVKE